MTDADVVVVGAGAAGIAAARAAHDAGARVVLVSGGVGATDMTAGWIAGALDGAGDAGVAVASWLAGVGLRAPGDYAFVSASGVRARAASGLASLLDLGAVGDGPVGVVDLVAGTAWDPELVARSLGRAARVVAPAGDAAPRGETAASVARALDTEGVADALGAALREGARACAALLFPPVLGLKRDDVAARVGAACGVRVGEAGGGPSDPTAVRLGRALARVVPAGVARVEGAASVEDAGDGRGRVVAAGRAWSPRAVVLATGGLAGGGVAFDGAFAEPCARAPVWLPGALAEPSAERGMDPMPLFAPDARGYAEALSAGVRVLDDGRVAAVDGRTPFRAWLYAAGAVVAGARGPYGPTVAEALVSGARAGKRAALGA